MLSLLLKSHMHVDIFVKRHILSCSSLLSGKTKKRSLKFCQAWNGPLCAVLTIFKLFLESVLAVSIPDHIKALAILYSFLSQPNVSPLLKGWQFIFWLQEQFAFWDKIKMMLMLMLMLMIIIVTYSIDKNAWHNHVEDVEQRTSSYSGY